MANDSRFNHNPGRNDQRDVLMARIGQACARRDSLEVVDMLVRADVTVAPVHTPLSVLDDPHVNSEGRILPVQIRDVAGRLPPLPYESSAYSFSVHRDAPAEPGQHTANQEKSAFAFARKARTANVAA